MRQPHREIQNYGWSVPVGTAESHYIRNARLYGRAGWLGVSACNVRSGGNVPLSAEPVGKNVCRFCANTVRMGGG